MIQTLFWGLLRCVLRLRYRVQVIGAEQLRTATGSALVMPNHPAYIDPPLGSESTQSSSARPDDNLGAEDRPIRRAPE
ncbi:MAG: hypothetical protein NTY19_48385 [Planctomycetota bacterium]|nr:hypothetical protein [Planctomycetota bacterium]